MAPKEPTRHQLSSRLQYQSHVPAFLQKFNNKIKGITSEDDDDEPQYYDDGSGRPPIPVRPAIPERPSDDPGSADEDDEDEKPQVVVLRAGKHLTGREAENERRKEKGLPPLPISDDESAKQDNKKLPSKGAAKSKQVTPSMMSFSSSNAKPSTSSNKLKRRIVTEGEDSGNEGDRVKKAPKKKSKREGKSLLSFGEDV
ncbi:hypothetical protein J3R82DRAFT_11268 [Butyriboletus roseoflavus]|nr:hypothetical protein J3R82DRAFT_11268 [Butyriboletus roseoflavus]